MSGAPCSLGSSSPAIINPGDDVVLTAPTVAPPAAAEVPLVVTMSSESADVTPSPETASCPPPIRIVVEADGSSVSPRSEEFGASDVAKTLEECAALGEPFVFEGPEKTLELEFSTIKGPTAGLRTLVRSQWDRVLEDAKCSILCSMSSEHFDSYVLSESSLFVYPHTAILKTCGTTTLLRCISQLLAYTTEIGMELEWVGYTRKNFTNPHKQLFPHTSPEDEVRYLRSVVDFNIEAFVLGPITSDHWYVIIAMHANRPAETSLDRTLDLMMYDLDPEMAANFLNTPEDVDHKSVTIKSGIDTIMPGAIIQEWAFTPCGYSCNAQLGDAYYTIHITPESHCSYASFETNIKLPSYTAILQTVLNLFKPKRFTLTMFADGEGVNRIEDTPYPMRYDSVAKGMAYQLSSRSHAEAGDYRSFLANYRLRSVEDPRSPLAPLVGSFGGLFRGPSASPASAMGTPLFGTA